MGRPRKVQAEDQSTMDNSNNEGELKTTLESLAKTSEAATESLVALAGAVDNISLSEDKRAWNERGLLKNVEYVYNEDDSINWLKMIPKEYFVINKQATNETDIEKVEDKNKLILLAGFKHLAFLRGYVDEDTTFISTSPEYVSAKTKIVWAGNFETKGREVGRSGAADAHSGNVSGKKAGNGFVATNFLMTIAENRSFVRAVKNFLRISVLGQDELGMNDEVTQTSPQAEPTSAAYKILQKVLDENNISFENFKNGMTKHVADGRIKSLDVQIWDTINDIPSDRLFELTKFIEARIAEKKAKA